MAPVAPKHALWHAAAFSALMALAFSAPAHAAQWTVSGPDALDSVVAASPAGDTVVFNLPGTDTVIMKYPVYIGKNLVIDGLNRATGHRMVLLKQGTSHFGLYNAKITLRQLILLGKPGKDTLDSAAVRVAAGKAQVLLDSVDISRMRVRFDGGALQMDSGTVTLRNCRFFGNWARRGGGIFAEYGTLRLENTSISNNRAGEGGGIYFNGARVSLFKSLIYADTSFEMYEGWNTPTFGSSHSDGVQAGGISQYGGRLDITESRIARNRAEMRAYHVTTHSNTPVTYPYSSAGGGIYSSSGTIAITASTVDSNEAYCYANSDNSVADVAVYSEGAGLYLSDGNLKVFQSTISQNRNITSTQAMYSKSYYNPEGSGIYQRAGHATLVNTTIAQNGDNDGNFSESYYDEGGALHAIFTTFGPDQTLYCGGSVYLLNTIAAKLESPYYITHIKGRNILASSVPGSQLFWNSNTSATAAQVFGMPAPLLADHGGPTKTLALSNPSSLAVGTGVRAGLQGLVVPQTSDTILKAAYYKNDDWYSMETDTLAFGTFREILDDQRGLTRAKTPGIGAFELTAGDPVPAQPRSTASPQPRIDLRGRRLFLRLPEKSEAVLTLHDLKGALLFSARMDGETGTAAFPLPAAIRGTVLCRVETAGRRFTYKLFAD